MDALTTVLFIDSSQGGNSTSMKLFGGKEEGILDSIANFFD